MPVSANLVVHADGGGFIDADDHRLARLATGEEVGDEILGDLLQPLIAGDEVILAGELALQLALLVVVEIGGRDQPLDVGVEGGVGELQFGDAVLVVERDGGAVFDGLAEVVDADVVAEDIAGLLLPDDQRGAGEGEEGGLGQGAAHVGGELVVLAAVRLIGDDDDVAAVGDFGIEARPARCGISGSG